MSNTTPSKKPLAILLGFTGNLAFAAGALALSVDRHMRGREYDILLFGTDLEDTDKAILRNIPRCTVHKYTPPPHSIREWSLQLFSSLCLAKFNMFDLLETYRCVVWLDCDVAVQGDFSAIVSYGPLGIALEDPSFTLNNQTLPVLQDFFIPEPGYDMMRPHYNSGVLVLHDTLPDPQGMKKWCLNKLDTSGSNLKYPDQAIFNMLAQSFPHVIKEFPYSHYNAHPANPRSLLAPLVHCFGPTKFWEDCMLSSTVPEWRRSYQRWLSMGGSPYAGAVEHLQYYDMSPYAVITELHCFMEKAQDRIDRLERELKEKKRRSARPVPRTRKRRLP